MKRWYQSRGVIGSLVVLACALFQVAVAFQHPEQDGPQLTAPQASATEILLQLGTLAGGGLALYGRIKAKSPINIGDGEAKADRNLPNRIPSIACLGLCLIWLGAAVGCGTNTAELPQRQATRGDNFNSGVTVNVNPLGIGRAPLSATPGLAGTPSGVSDSNAVQAAHEQPTKLADSLSVGNVTVNVTVETRSEGGGTLTASTAGGSTGPQTATPTTTVNPNLNANLPGSVGTP